MADEHDNTPAPAAEYQHHIPRLVLRNFARTYQGRSKKFGQPGLKHRVHRDNHILDAAHLAADNPSFIETTAKKTFGQDNMYECQSSISVDQWKGVENQLSKLESAASVIFREMLGAQAAGESNISLDDTQYATLMKFVFVMKYRSTLFFKRYDYERAEDYIGGDKAELMAYMRAKKLHRPIDV
jgi:hypothetical protein